MLSHENNPSDPLKSIGNSTVHHNSSDENITGGNSLPEVEHQLNSSSVEAHNFSIRDFVSSARNKDIGKNWPFPEKHLKLCLKHGVKDLLPPFQSKTFIRKHFSSTCLEKNSLVDDGNITSILDEEPSAKVDSLTVCFLGDVALTQKITADHLGVNFDKPDKDSDFPSSVTSNSQAYPSASGGTFKHHKFPKNSAKTSANKCKLIVKFGSPSVHSANEEIIPHKTNISDSPASKVCPVCKTFSSSSNTTLNAHIDQCLSMETTSEGVADSKIGTKCKVKLRKMRSMVDIYATALVCTIEDLDRRNGSSWATDLSLTARNIGVNYPQGNKKLITSPTEPDKEDNDDGGVYIDANGRKLRILSKMDSFSSVVTTKEDHGSRKPQISKILSSSKKKHQGNRYLKHAVSSEKLFSPKANPSEVSRNQNPSNDALLSKHTSDFQIKRSRDIDDRETFRDEGMGMHQHPGRKLHAVQRSTIKSQKSRLGSSSQDFYKESDSTCLIESRKRMKSSDDIHMRMKRCLGVKRTGLSISKDDKNYKTDRNCHKRLKRSTEYITGSTYVGKDSSTWKPLKKLNRPELEIDENRPSPGSTKHIHRFLHKSAKLSKGNTSSPSQQILCSTNEEDQVQIEVVEEEDEYEDLDNNEHVATWQSESHVIHDDTVTEAERTEDDFIENLGVPGKGRSDKVTDPLMNLTAERTMRSFIRSMNPDIHERADSYDHQSSPQPSKDSSTGPTSAPCHPDTVFGGGVCNYSIMELESNATQGNPCSDVDPIPIPGPPGSFLPSPGNAETEDYQGNSSLTASLSSSLEQVSGNSLDVPNSPVSSAFNLAAETTKKIAEMYPCTGNRAIPDSSLLGLPNPISEVSIPEARLFPQVLKGGVSPNEHNNQKSYVKLQDNTQPCCCSRKERVQRGGSVVDYQESQILRRRTMPAVVIPVKENISCSLNTAPSYSYACSDIYSLSSSSSFRVETFPVSDKPAGFSSPKRPDTANKFNANGDAESASPSAVLRLMGKNLMVAKNDEDLSDTSTQMPRCKAASRSYCSQSGRAVPTDPAMNSPSYSNMKHSLDFRMPNGPWGEISFPRPDLRSPSPAVLTRMPEMHIINRGLPASFDNKWPTPKNGFDTSSSIDFRKPSMIRDDDDAGREARAWKRDITVKGKGTSMASEQEQSRLIYPVYPGFPPAPIYMQQASGNSCFPLPFSSGRALNPQVNFSQNGSYVLQGGPFMASSSPSSTHQKPGLFYSPRLP